MIQTESFSCRSNGNKSKLKPNNMFIQLNNNF